MSIATDSGAQAGTGLHGNHAVRPYRLAAKVFHWATAVLIVFMVASGITMKQLGSGAVMDFIFTLHKTTGALIESSCWADMRIGY